MNTDQVFQITQGFFALASIALILLQPPEEETDNSANWFSSRTTKRGWEKLMFLATIISIVCFTLISALRLILV
jgi:preprotein translocase subunit SecG